MGGTRSILQEAANGGTPCSGTQQTYRSCNTETCPGTTNHCTEALHKFERIIILILHYVG